MKTELNARELIDALRLKYMSLLDMSEKAESQVNTDKLYHMAKGVAESIDTVEQMAELID